jgi:hypothetical protein
MRKSPSVRIAGIHGGRATAEVLVVDPQVAQAEPAHELRLHRASERLRVLLEEQHARAVVRERVHARRGRR